MKYDRVTNSPFHDDEETLLAVIRVLVDVHDVDDVLAGRGPPMQVDLASRLRVVLEHLEGEFVAGFLVLALDDLAVDAEAEDDVGHAVVVGERRRLDVHVGRRSRRLTYDGE